MGSEQWAVEATGLVKRYGGRAVLDGLSLRVPRGGVHGLLGPNGSGKTTTIRILLGLARATQGHATILGHDVPRDLPHVIGRVGAIVESPKFAPRMTGRQNLDVLAVSIGQPRRRVMEVLLEVSLVADADRRFGTYSLGMKQRLAIAATLLKSPELLIFDEPTNGLDPVGIHEIRSTMRGLADAGRTVLVSSHILSEVEQIADSMSIIARGRLVAEGSMDDFLRSGTPHVRVVVDDDVRAAEVLRSAGWRVESQDAGLRITCRDGREPDPACVARALGAADLWPRELRADRHSLEQVFLELTADTNLPSREAA
ncbi:ABC transporter ATP-binding protein [Tessaracoccus lacteus]|uniref:ATP-binding cassette domain-containing protein n=1 Tax=Tessaracoccus lacteus TaxID=3041766 RepID=A0ABY8PWU5_9ACTN|nr:ATP-binding cassette domain-containing protein [Tessaracoccus sp. T21]WGT46925.1 ATP-binding cassette domain-containing protein [Tessaracoccus sp. T21]